MRFGTGTDNGIFKVQEMLVRHLGFASADVELSYFNIDSPGKPKQCTLGQDPPTVTNFKLKFTELCKSAVPGEVRFLYVDAYGTNRINEDHSGQPDDKTKGWVLAENDDGTRTESLPEDWLGEVIRNVSIERLTCLALLVAHRWGILEPGKGCQPYHPDLVVYGRWHD